MEGDGKTCIEVLTDVIGLESVGGRPHGIIVWV
jgi:hypothetical protein